jgi:hypothetical protein
MVAVNTNFVGEVFFARGDGGSPEAFTRQCTVFSIGGLGETRALVETTTFCSDGFREYIDGLADGSEVTIELNYQVGNTSIQQLIADAKSGAVKNYQLQVGDSSPSEAFEFAAVPLSWMLNPSVDSKNTATFTFKISGEISIA